MANATFLYLGTADGLRILTRPGTSKEWNPTRHALDGQRIGALARGDLFPIRLLAATPAGLQRTTNGGRTWDSVLPAAVSMLAANPADLELVFALAQDADGATMLLSSDDGGAMWEQGARLPVAPTAHGLAVTAGEPPGLWLGLPDGAVLYSAGLDFNWISTGPAPGDAAVEAIIPAGAGSVYAAAGEYVYHLSVAPGSGEIARELVGVTPSPVAHLLLLGMIDKPGATSLLAATADGALLHSAGDGAWLPLNGAADSGLDADQQVSALAAHPEYPDRGYLATRSGAIYETANRGKRWSRLDFAAPGEVLALLSAVLK